MLAEVPAPSAGPGTLLIQTRMSVVSLGTERMLVDFGRSSWLDKARKQPDKVKQVLAKVKTDGLMPTIEAVRSKLDQPLALGYCNAGVVLEVGRDVAGFAVGDRVVSNGPHAELVCVPKHLCAKLPDNVTDEEAGFTVLGAIGLQAVRLLNPQLGERVVVLGLGIIGLLTVQLLRANGCAVLGFDFDEAKCALARQFGAEAVNLSTGSDPVACAMAFSNSIGVDGVVIAASTSSNDPIRQSAQMCRKRGRIVLLGVTGLEISRADFYEKELTFQVSCSYGPGRYDENYELKGQDYPVGFVRWTEQRNFEAFLQVLSGGGLRIGPLITHRFAFEDCLKAYESDTLKKAMGVVLRYGAGDVGLPKRTVKIPAEPSKSATEGNGNGKAVVGLLGAGGFTTQVLMPALKRTGARLKSVCSRGGVSAAHLARKFQFEQATTDPEVVLADPEVNTLMISTRHDSHARYVIQGLKAGKKVYVEKPLCLTREEFKAIREVHDELVAQGKSPFLMVGFNRRFSPHAKKLKALLRSTTGPKSFIMTVNAGMIPATHWTQKTAEGGGRIIGEGCHWVDLLRYLAGAEITNVAAMKVGPAKGVEIREDKLTALLAFADGSTGALHYIASGHKSFPKERLEIFADGRVLQLDNFRRLTGYGWPGFKSMNLWSQDKGHGTEMAELVGAVAVGGPSPMPFAEIVEVTEATFKVVEGAI